MRRLVYSPLLWPPLSLTVGNASDKGLAGALVVVVSAVVVSAVVALVAAGWVAD
jgi:hypothetical protein